MVTRTSTVVTVMVDALGVVVVAVVEAVPACCNLFGEVAVVVVESAVVVVAAVRLLLAARSRVLSRFFMTLLLPVVS